MTSAVPPLAPEPFYRQRFAELRQLTDSLWGRRRRLQWAGLLGLLSILVLGIVADRGSLPWWSAAVPLPVVIGVVLAYNGVRRRLLAAARLTTHNESALRRVTGEAVQSGFEGREFFRTEHLYDPDLGVLGGDSLFGLLATVRTGAAQRALADRLLNPAPPIAEIVSRQAAVRELAPATALRER